MWSNTTRFLVKDILWGYLKHAGTLNGLTDLEIINPQQSGLSDYLLTIGLSPNPDHKSQKVS